MAVVVVDGATAVDVVVDAVDVADAVVLGCGLGLDEG